MVFATPPLFISILCLYFPLLLPLSLGLLGLRPLIATETGSAILGRNEQVIAIDTPPHSYTLCEVEGCLPFTLLFRHIVLSVLICYIIVIVSINSCCYCHSNILVDRLVVGIYEYPPLLGILPSLIIFTSLLLLIDYYLWFSMPPPASVYAGGYTIWVIHSTSRSILEAWCVRVEVAYLYYLGIIHQ